MRKVNAAWPEQLCAIRDGKPPGSAPAVAALERAGLVRASLTPAGYFALKKGFTPGAKELELLGALECGEVLSGTSWQRDADGRVTSAPGKVLARFRTLQLAHGGPGRLVDSPCSATDKARGLAIELTLRFGRGWAWGF